MINNKRGSAWIWVLIIVIIISVVVYFLLSGDVNPVVSSSNTIPQPPAFPSV